MSCGRVQSIDAIVVYMHPVNVTVTVLPLYPLGLFQLVILKNVREIVMFYNRRRSVVGSPPTGSFFFWFIVVVDLVGHFCCIFETLSGF